MGTAAEKRLHMKLKILSWNIWLGGVYLDKITDFLRSFKADIVGLQEVTQTPQGKKNIAQQLAQELGYEWVYATGMDLRPYGKNLVMGNAVLSKYPIISKRTHTLSKTDTRTAIQADLSVNKTVIHVLSTHLLHTHQQPSIIQEEQAETLAAAAPKERTIIMGDFNATPDSRTVQILRTSFRKADGDSVQPTWSVYPQECCDTHGLTIRLDYMFVTPDVRTKKFAIENSDGSDHVPISAEMEV